MKEQFFHSFAFLELGIIKMHNYVVSSFYNILGTEKIKKIKSFTA